MKTQLTFDALKHCAFILFISLSLLDVEASDANTASKFGPVDPNQIPQILNMISTQVRDNYERIKTWQGERDVVMDYIDEGSAAEKTFKTHTDGVGEIPNIVKRRVECITQFAVDIERNFLYVSNYWEKPAQYTDLESGRDLGSKSAPDFKKSIVTPEYYIHCRPNTMSDGSIINRKAVKEALPECPTCDGPSVFDPRELFGLPLQPVWVTFPRMIKVINERGEYSIDAYALKVEERKDGGITEYRIQKPGKLSLEPGKLSSDNYLFKTRTFSSTKGFNVILEKMTHPDGKLIYRSTLDYELINGVYLVSRTTRQTYNPRTGTLTYRKECTFKNQKVNKPIPEGTFTYKNLGLQDGDRFIDKVLDKEYVYQNGVLAEVEANKK